MSRDNWYEDEDDWDSRPDRAANDCMNCGDRLTGQNQSRIQGLCSWCANPSNHT